MRRGFRSADEPFFNFKTNLDTGSDAESESNQLLYPPRVSFVLPAQVPSRR